MNNPISLVCVAINDGQDKRMSAAQSNKYYKMVDNGDGTFTASWGRVGEKESTKTYPIKKWNSTYRSKLKKGYKDISALKEVVTETVEYSSSNKSFDDFFKIFSNYASITTKKSYLVDSCTPAQLKEAQDILDEITKLSVVDSINKKLLELYTVIPRKMDNVKNYIISKPEELNKLVQREQDAIDSIDSSSIIKTQKTVNELDIEFDELDNVSLFNQLANLINKTNSSKYKIYKVYKVSIPVRTKKFNKWLDDQKNKSCEYLIHGTRNANIFSILKSGLLIRPSNAAMISGAAYGNGIYHSAHTDKSLGYTGYDPDKIFLIQNVHMGNPFVYDGWYRGNSFTLNYKNLSERGYDSTYVKPGNGLRNSEYIVYKEEQSDTAFLVWMK